MKPLFQLRPDADLDLVINHLGLLISQSKAVQSNLFELSCSKHDITNNYLEINALSSQTESNLEQMEQLWDYLTSRQLVEVKK
ncbi:MAG: hypothetical protein R3F02_02140 [Thiolinea sp.]